MAHPRPIPSPQAAVPRSLTDPDVIAACDWDAFRGLTTLVNHWDRPGWTPGRRSYHWFLTFPDAPELVSLARTLQEGIARFALDPIPEDGLHVTIAKLGFTDEVSANRLGSAIEAAEHVCATVGPFTLQAIPLAGSPGAVRFSLAPWAPLIALREALSGSRSNSVFRPHLGIAYGNRTMSARPVIDAVAELRSAARLVLPVSEVHLVELRREQRVYRWDTVKSFPLGQGGTMSADD